MEREPFESLWQKATPMGDYLDGVDGQMTVYRDVVDAKVLALNDIPVLDRDIRVLAFSEKWCPDCVLNLSILKFLVESGDRISVRILGREGHEAVIGALNEAGKAYIPTLVFYDGERYLGTFVERPRALKDRLNGCSQVERIQLMQAYKSGGFQKETLAEYLELMNR